MNIILNKSAEQDKVKLEKQRIKEASLEAAKRVREVVVAGAALMVVLDHIIGPNADARWP